MSVIGTEAVELVIPRVAAQIRELKHQRAIVAEEVEKLLDDFPLFTVLTSMPGVGIKTAATMLLTIGDARTFLARRRGDVIYSMLRHGTFYDEKPTQAA